MPLYVSEYITKYRNTANLSKSQKPQDSKHRLELVPLCSNLLCHLPLDLECSSGFK